MDILAKKYFQYKFKDLELTTKKYGGEPWYGFFLEDECIVGCPVNNNNNEDIWFFYGEYFSGGSNFLDLSIDEFKKKIKEYIKYKLPNISINRIV